MQTGISGILRETMPGEQCRENCDDNDDNEQLNGVNAGLRWLFC
jgi:hypothetical protein